MLPLNEKIQDALLEAVFVTRWNHERTSMYAILDACETKQVMKDVVDELDKAGLQIVEKEVLV